MCLVAAKMGRMPIFWQYLSSFLDVFGAEGSDFVDVYDDGVVGVGDDELL